MKKLILDEGEYSFNAADRTITLTAHTDLLKKEYLLLVTNTTDNQIIYNFGCDGYGGIINEITNTVTLEYDTSSMQNSDRLQIVLYTEMSDTDTNMLELLQMQTESLECLNNILEQQKLTNQWLKEILR